LTVQCLRPHQAMQQAEEMATHWCLTEQAHQLERSDTQSSPEFVLVD